MPNLRNLIAFFPAFFLNLSMVNAEQIIGLQQLLKRDWGYDLPIDSGAIDAGSRANPIIIKAIDPVEVGEAAYFTIHGLHRGLSKSYENESRMVTGVIWKILGGLEQLDGLGLYSAKVERTILKEDEIVEETASYYFSIPGSSALPAKILFEPEGYYFEQVDLQVPFQISSLQLNNRFILDYEKKHGSSNLGQSVGYSATGIEATVYVYPISEPFNENMLKNEFKQAAADVLAIDPERKHIAWPDRHIEGKLYRRYWRIGEEGFRASALWLFRYKDHIVKLRMTWTRDHKIDELASEFPNELLKVILN